MKSIIFFLLLSTSVPIFGQNFLLTSNCELPSTIKIWVNSKFIHTVTLKAYEVKWIDLPSEGWMWIEGYSNYKAAGKRPTSTKKTKGKSMKFAKSPKILSEEFNGYIANCPCELLGA